ncbi:LppA family lipoprotein [Psychromicrobium sp. YIM B11713]|uniref:LppA family lipoprotein n=1 Tax=Psychromicrobium sp. YIM B11713 TaxID=3145233 RepID=UPI00374F1FFC
MSSIDFNSRPSLQAVVDKYDSMLERMKTELSAAFDGVQWTEFQQGTSIDVAVPGAPGQAVNYSSAAWVAELPLQGADRDKALQILSKVGADYGFAAPQTMQSNESHIEVTGSDALGARYELSSGSKTTLSYLSGLHLAQKLKSAD